MTGGAQRFYRRAAAGGLLAFALSAPAFAAAKFEPPAGKVLLIIGQDLAAAEAYVTATKAEPAGYMGYTGITEAEGLSESFDGGGGQQFAERILEHRPDAVFQIGLYMVDRLEDVSAGRQDETIDRLGEWIKAAKRPVFLRVGYEFDFPQNHYEPEAYKKAYRHVVDRLRAKGVDNVAFVWHSCACGPADRVMDWYPGDTYVDWFAVSLFAQFPKTVEKVAATARRIKKPLMVAEGSAWNARNEALKLAWFRRAFKFIQANDVKAFSYINWNWDEIPAFASNNWGDARVNATPAVLKAWNEETSKDIYLKGGAATLKAIGAR